jgi:hypothetical protein
MDKLAQQFNPRTQGTFGNRFLTDLPAALAGGAGADSFSGGFGGALQGIEGQRRYQQQQADLTQQRSLQMQQFQNQLATDQLQRENYRSLINERVQPSGFQRVNIEDPSNPGKGMLAIFDPNTGEVLDPTTKEKIIGAKIAPFTRSTESDFEEAYAQHLVDNQLPDTAGNKISFRTQWAGAGIVPRLTTGQSRYINPVTGEITLIPYSSVSQPFPGGGQPPVPVPSPGAPQAVPGDVGEPTEPERNYRRARTGVGEMIRLMGEGLDDIENGDRVAGLLKVRRAGARLPQLIRTFGEVGNLSATEQARGERATVSGVDAILGAVNSGYQKINRQALQELADFINVTDATRYVKNRPQDLVDINKPVDNATPSPTGRRRIRY